MAKTSVLTEPQLQEATPFEEQIQISPLGTSCSGICVEKEVKQADSNLARSDRDIKRELQSLLRREDRVSIRVDNGAVFLSGSVKDRSIAANLVQQVEATPGVHWISVNFNCPENQS
ncbi:MAG: BON domain-containing protein [Cyanobacteria bacterium P01_E01_bin.34]